MSGPRFVGRRAIVTGSVSGIGRAIVHALLAEGATVEGIDLAVPEDDESRPHAVHRVADVSDEASVKRTMGAILGTGPVTDVFNVAGIGSTTAATETSVEAWDRVMAVNARGTFLICKHAIPALVSQGGGSIVNVASIAGLVGLRNRAAYCASKGAVIALTRALAIEHVGDGVRVNCVCPGTVDSPWVRRLVDDVGESIDALRSRQPMGRLGTPDEVAGAAVYLASDAAAFITGSTLVIDGGLTAG